MTNPQHDNSDPEARELTAAVEDIAYRLTHDLSDTPDDVRDAVAFAPLAVVKFLHNLAAEVSRRPKATIALVTAAAAGIGLLAVALWRRSGTP